jgi:DNA replication protein
METESLDNTGEKMSFETKTPEDLIRIAAAGGGFRFNAGLWNTDDLVRIATAAESSGALLFLSGMSIRTTGDLVRIGTAGKGNVVFED